MKHLLRIAIPTLVFCLVAFSTKAQYVTIPDANFVAYLQTTFPTCMNGNQMDTTRVDTITQVNCSHANVSDLTGIEYFDSLKTLKCSFNSLIILPSLPSSLKQLDCSANNITSLNLPSTLELLNCSVNPIDSLPVLPVTLTDLICNGNGLTTLPQLPTGLESLGCSNNQLTGLPALPATLIGVNCDINYITALPSLPAGLMVLSCDHNSLSTLPVLPYGLLSLDCSYNPLTAIPGQLSQLGGLSMFYCSGNQLTSLPPLPNALRHFDCSNNQLTSLPALPLQIETLWCQANPNLYCLPDLRQLEHLEFDSANILCLPNYGAIQTSVPSIANVPLCGIMNTHNCSPLWNITGNVYNDDNNNCIRNVGEAAISILKISLLQGGTLLQQTITASNGNYTFDTGFGNYEVKVDTTGIPFTVSCPIGGVNTAVLTALDSFETLDFALQCKPGFDVGAWSVNMAGRPRPAEIATINVHVGDYAYFWNQQHCNTTNVSGQVVVTISGPGTYMGAANGALTPVVAGNVLTYNISNWSAVNPSTDFRFLLQTDTSAQIGQQVCFSVSVTPLSGDNNVANNMLTHCYDVISSYDPNDKLVSPVGGIDTAQKWLTYTVNFQNTGNAEAIHIYITDTLDANVDESSFQLLAYSHQPMVYLKGKALRFNFANINLPDSNTNEPASHGYVQYKVKLKDNLPIGTTINNTAFIYFDFNAPVITNTASNTIVQDTVTVGVASITGPSFSIYPNPANSLLYVTTNGAPVDALRIYSATGQLLLVVKQPSNAPVNIGTLSNGVYVAEIVSSGVTTRKRWVKL